jgi:hypothetical protein
MHIHAHARADGGPNCKPYRRANAHANSLANSRADDKPNSEPHVKPDGEPHGRANSESHGDSNAIADDSPYASSDPTPVHRRHARLRQECGRHLLRARFFRFQMWLPRGLLGELAARPANKRAQVRACHGSTDHDDHYHRRCRNAPCRRHEHCRGVP